MPDYNSNFISANYEKNLEKERNRKKRNGDARYKKHLKDLAELPGYIPSGAYLYTPWRDKTRKSYYKRYYRGKISHYVKNQCNRAVRRCKELLQRGMKNKYTEFWWEID